jgi:hypothetical protein
MNNPNQTQAELQEELADIQAEIAERQKAVQKAAGLVSWLENCNDPCGRLPAAQAELQEAELFLVETKRELAQAAAKLAEPKAAESKAAAIAAELNRDAAGTERAAEAALAAACLAWQSAQVEHARKLAQAAELRALAKLAAEAAQAAELKAWLDELLVIILHRSLYLAIFPLSKNIAFFGTINSMASGAKRNPLGHFNIFLF